MTIAEEMHDPEVRVVHIVCTCDYGAALETVEPVNGKYLSLCLRCSKQDAHDEPHEQRSSNGVGKR